MDRFEQYIGYVEWGLVVAVVLLGLVAAIRLSRPHLIKPGAQIVGAILPFVAVFVVMTLAGVGVSPIAAIVAVIVGAGLGVLVGRGAPVRKHEDRAVVKPSSATTWLSSAAWVLAAAAIVFMGPAVTSVALTLVLAFAAIGLAEAVMHIMKARRLA